MSLRPTWVVSAGGIAAALLLVSFYLVVTDAARTGHASRQQTSASDAKQAVCGMRSAAARDLCMLTLASPASLASTGSRWTGQTPSNSTSNINVAFGGMTPPAPRAP